MTSPIESGSLYSNNTGYDSSVDVTVSTIGADKLLVAFCTTGQGDEPIVSGGGLSWIKIGSIQLSAAGSTWTAIYVAWAASAITNQTITASQSGTSPMTIDVQAYADSQDYSGLVANTDYAVSTFAETGDNTSNLSLSLTTKAADSELRAICSFFDSGASITWSNNANCGTINDQVNTVASHVVERTDGPHSIGSYTIGADHGNGDGWRGGGIVAFELLGAASGSTAVDLVINDISHGHAAAGLALSSDALLIVDDLLHQHATDNLTLSITTAVNLLINDLLHGVSTDHLSLSSEQTLAIAELLHAVTAENVALSSEQAIIIDDVLHGQALDDLNLSTEHALSVANILHAVYSDNLTFSADVLLAINEVLHGHTAGDLELTTEQTLEVAELLHAVTVESIALSTEFTLLVNDVLHSLTSEQLVLSTESTLAISDVLHGLAFDNVALGLSGVENLQIDDVVHAVNSDELSLSSDLLLQVNGLRHAHAVDTLLLSTEASLVIANTLHAHEAASLSLSTEISLVIADALHAHFADAVVLEIGSLAVIYGRRENKIIAVGMKRTSPVTRSRPRNIQISRRK